MKTYIRQPSWHDTGNTTGGVKYWYAEPSESVVIPPLPGQPRVITTTTTTPVYQEEFSVVSHDDEKSELVYSYLVNRESHQAFSLESIKIELLGTISLQKGELLSILVQMVSDGILSFDRRTARYALMQ